MAFKKVGRGLELLAAKDQWRAFVNPLLTSGSTKEGEFLDYTSDSQLFKDPTPPPPPPLSPCRRRDESMYSSYSFLTWAVDGVSGQRHAPATLNPR
jgi:hypothetical protein